MNPTVPALGEALRRDGFARVPGLLTGTDCRALRALWDDRARFRSVVHMDRQGYGRGEYRYFARPLPGAVARLRRTLYAALRPIAAEWAEALGWPAPPPSLAALGRACRAAGQTRPTPLLLRYGSGDYNRLHQDRYGAVAFPLQITVGLTSPDTYEGGEFLLVEHWPRMQSRGVAIRLGLGEAVVFANAERPVPGRSGWRRVGVRHGVSPLRAGDRLALGIIFHDAA
jgi:hypothetical protein